MDITPSIFNAKVMHKRFFPKENGFTYGIYYLALPLPAAPVPGKSVRFNPHDLGARDGTDPKAFVQNILCEHGLDAIIQDIIVVTMPCILGYVFNPVSFYMCFDQDNILRAVVAEVHNTFGEQYVYLCAHEDHRPIDAHDVMIAEKLFHVSPFLERKGRYRFRFAMPARDKLGIWIDYYDENDRKQLATSLIGQLEPLTAASLRRAFWRHPLVTLKTIYLIHWQALKLVIKKIKYVPKPEQLNDTLSVTSDAKKHPQGLESRKTRTNSMTDR